MRSDTNPELLPAKMIRFSKLKPLSKNNSNAIVRSVQYQGWLATSIAIGE